MFLLLVINYELYYDILQWTGEAQSVDLYLTIQIISLFEID